MKNSFSRDIKGSLSPLESDVISILKNNRSYKVRDIYHLIKKSKKVAQSSVSVILDRLYEKGLVQRKPETCRGGMRFIYKIKKDRLVFERSIIEGTVNKLLDKFGDSAVTYFNERFSKPKKGDKKLQAH